MPYFKYANLLVAEAGSEFDTLHRPGAATPYSGIYRCEGCHHSITSTKPHPLPPQNHHQHDPASVPIQWRLAVKSHYA